MLGKFALSYRALCANFQESWVLRKWALSYRALCANLQESWVLGKYALSYGALDANFYHLYLGTVVESGRLITNIRNKNIASSNSTNSASTSTMPP